jgi:hypothetical protein
VVVVFVGSAVAGFVASHGDAGVVVVLLEDADDVSDHGAFTGTADGEVADADDGPADVGDADAGVKAAVAPVDLP